MRYCLKKGCTLIITLLLISILVFLAFQLIPGDPVTKLLGTEATPEAAAALRAELGLDESIPVRYWNWLTGFLRGDMGVSYSYSLPVEEMVAEKLPTTALLTAMAFVITVVLSIPLGILAGSIRNPVIDKIVIVADQFVMSVPAFFVGVLFCYVFGILLRVFIPGNFIAPSDDLAGCLFYLLFPAIAIALPRTAMTVKMLRSTIRKELGQDYVRTAVSRGAARNRILQSHVLRNALIPTIAFLAVSAAEIMTGTIIIEQVFSLPGLGRLLMASIGNRDIPVVQAIVLIFAAWIVVVHFLADLLYQLVDPRLR